MLRSFSGIENHVVPWSKDRTFRAFMLKFAKEFKQGDLEELKYALRKRIPRGEMEKLKTPLSVFNALEDRNIVTLGKLEELRNLLADIDRPHLISMVDEFDDSLSSFPLKPKSENYLDMEGYRLAIDGGRHFETSEGEFVEVRSGSNYALTLTNTNSFRCVCEIKIDGYPIFRGGFRLHPHKVFRIERPSTKKKLFKFFAVADAPEGSGINKWRRDVNGLIEAVFTPEKADMKIRCVSKGAPTQILTCSYLTTDTELYSMILNAFGVESATIMVNSWKPLGQKGAALADYGIKDGSQIQVNVGGKAGVSITSIHAIQNKSNSKKDPKWRAGATTLEGESQQEFLSVKGLSLDPSRAVTLNLRLVAREDVRPLLSTGTCTSLVKATLIPPPVPS